MKNEESKTVSTNVRTSEALEKFVEKISENYGLKKNRVYNLFVYFGAGKWMEMEKEARNDVIGIFETPEEVTDDRIKKYIKSQVEKYRNSGKISIVSLKNTVYNHGSDELFLMLMYECFNGGTNKKDG